MVIRLQRNLRNRNDALPERIVNPVSMDLGMFRASVQRAFEVDQSDESLRAEVAESNVRVADGTEGGNMVKMRAVC